MTKADGVKGFESDMDIRVAIRRLELTREVSRAPSVKQEVRKLKKTFLAQLRETDPALIKQLPPSYQASLTRLYPMPRFQATLRALIDCHEHMDDIDLSESEEKAKEALIKLCQRIAEEEDWG